MHPNDNVREDIRIVPECGHSVAGTWGDKDSTDKGAVCWLFEHGSHAVEIPWPDSIFCRNCKKTFTKEQIQKRSLQPTYYDRKENSFNCGCQYIDSSD